MAPCLFTAFSDTYFDDIINSNNGPIRHHHCALKGVDLLDQPGYCRISAALFPAVRHEIGDCRLRAFTDVLPEATQLLMQDLDCVRIQLDPLPGQAGCFLYSTVIANYDTKSSAWDWHHRPSCRFSFRYWLGVWLKCLWKSFVK